MVNLTDTEDMEPNQLSNSMYDEASLSILRTLARRGETNSHVLRRETGLPKHLIESRVRSDGILMRAGLVELVGYDDDTRFTNAPKILALTEFAETAMDYGFLHDVEESDGTVVLDEQQFEEFETCLSALETQLESLSDSFREHCDTYKEMSRFITVELYFELAMVRDMLRELGVPVQHMQETREALGDGYRNGADLTETFYEQESK
jgi:hypothetical protein